MNLSLRNATEKDAILTFEIEQNSIAEYADKIYSSHKSKYLAEFNHHQIQIVELNNIAIGYLEIDEKNHSFEIINILIHKDFQNRGFGKKIILDLICISESKSKGIELQVLKNNPKAKRFYENAGFQVYFETEFEYKMKFSHANRLFRN